MKVKNSGKHALEGNSEMDALPGSDLSLAEKINADNTSHSTSLRKTNAQDISRGANRNPAEMNIGPAPPLMDFVHIDISAFSDPIPIPSTAFKGPQPGISFTRRRRKLTRKQQK